MVKMKFVLIAFALLPATALCATINFLELEPEEAQRLMAAQSQQLVFAKKLSSFPLPEPVLEKRSDGQGEVLRGVEFYNGRPIKNYADFYEDNFEASQFHGQDGLGRYLFGFSAPNHARVEERNQEGIVRGSYQYIGPYDEPIKVEYWADKDGFHQTDNLAIVGPQPVEETPEVKAARLEHERLWKEAADKATAQPDPLSDEYNKMALAYDASQEKVDHETENSKPSDELTRYPKLPYSEHIKPDATGNSQEGVVIENASMKSAEMGPPKGFFYSFDYPVRAILRKEGTQEVLDEEYAQGKQPFPQLPPAAADSASSSLAASTKTNELHPHFRNTAANIEAEAPQESIVVENVQAQNAVADKFEKKSQPTTTEGPVEIQVPVQIVPVPVVIQKLEDGEKTHEKEHTSDESEKKDESSEAEKVSTLEEVASTTESKPEDVKDEAVPSQEDKVDTNASDEEAEIVKSGIRFDDTTDKSDEKVDKADVTTAKSDTTAGESESASDASGEISDDVAEKADEVANKPEDIAGRFGDDKSDDSTDKPADTAADETDATEKSDDIADKSDEANTTSEKSADKSDDSIEQTEAPAEKSDETTVKSDTSIDTIETVTSKSDDTDEADDLATKADEETTDKSADTTDMPGDDSEKADESREREEEMELFANDDSATSTDEQESKLEETEIAEKSQEQTTDVTESPETYDKSTESVSTDGTAIPTLKESNEDELELLPLQESKRVDVTAEVLDEKDEGEKANDETTEKLDQGELGTTPEDIIETEEERERMSTIMKNKQEVASMIEELSDIDNRARSMNDEEAMRVQLQTIAKADTLINAMKEYFAEQGVEPLDETPDIMVNDMAADTAEEAPVNGMGNHRQFSIRAMRTRPLGAPMGIYDMQLSDKGDGISYPVMQASQEIK